jgi:hypothetical protein
MAHTGTPREPDHDMGFVVNDVYEPHHTKADQWALRVADACGWSETVQRVEHGPEARTRRGD